MAHTRAMVGHRSRVIQPQSGRVEPRCRGLAKNTAGDIVLILAKRREWLCSTARGNSSVTQLAHNSANPGSEVERLRFRSILVVTYGRARLLLVPSMWWESGPRVIVEALLNGIPVIGSDSEGIAEVLGEGGQIFDVPAEYRQAPYARLFDENFIRTIADKICRYYDDERYYQQASARAREEYARQHNLERNGDALLACIQQCLQTRAQGARS